MSIWITELASRMLASELCDLKGQRGAFGLRLCCREAGKDVLTLLCKPGMAACSCPGSQHALADNSILMECRGQHDPAARNALPAWC